jgi:hypothetical protein
MTDNKQKKEMTQEEIVAREKELISYYNSKKQFLKAQLEHEELLAKIDEARFKRARYEYETLKMYAELNPSPNQPTEQTNSEETK